MEWAVECTADRQGVGSTRLGEQGSADLSANSVTNTRPRERRRLALASSLLLLLGSAGTHAPQASASRFTPLHTPIRHVVLIDEENHSFDNILGRFCADVAAGVITRPGLGMSCAGTTNGRLPDGRSIPLSRATDLVPIIDHSVAGQQTAVDAGRMDGFSRILGCGPSGSAPFACYSQFDPTQVPNITSLARTFAISDRTFEFRSTPSWVGHMVLASATRDGFTGSNPIAARGAVGPGWGCDSRLDARWSPGIGVAPVLVPACVPDRTGQGPFRASPVRYVPTIFDRLDAAGLSWRIYGGLADPTDPGSGYGWTICPTFFECLGTRQAANMEPARSVLAAARTGTLPSYSIVTPTAKNSQHNSFSMTVGDNWIGDVVGAIERGPDWASTAIFITWDDCGCFYDHVAPPRPSWGIRVPTILVSPYAKPGFTDSHNASFVSALAFVEHVFGLRPLNRADASSYDYADAFDFNQTPATPSPMTHTSVSPAELRYIDRHLSALDPT